MKTKKRVKIGKWKTVFYGTIFEIKQAEAEYSNGRKQIFEKAFRTPSVLVLPITSKGKLIMTREYRIGSNNYQWFFPAGRMDKEKDPKKAAQRELQEEIGMRAGKLTLISKHGITNTMEYINYVFLAENLSESKIEVDEDEDIEIHEVTIKEALRKVLDGEVEARDICFAIIQLHKYLKERK